MLQIGTIALLNLGASLTTDVVEQDATVQLTLPIYLVAFLWLGFWKFFLAFIRDREINEGFFVTSILFAFNRTANITTWQAALGITFGVVITKEIFGGTGRNFKPSIGRSCISVLCLSGSNFR